MDSTHKQEADTHAPPAGYVARPTITHGDQLPDGVPLCAIGKAHYPATIFAMNIIRMDSGGPSWPAEDAPQVPLCWHPFLPVIEAGLNTLDGGDRSQVDLDNEMFTFCSGEEDAARTLRERSQALGLAALFLNDFFEGWSYFASEVGGVAPRPLRRCSEEEAEEISLSVFDWPDGRTLTQHREFMWGDHLLILGEINRSNVWDDQGFDEATAALERALS